VAILSEEEVGEGNGGVVVGGEVVETRLFDCDSHTSLGKV